MDFTRGHHFVLTYDWNIGNDFHLRVEPYLQLLYKVPVVAGSSNSLINNKDDWFITDKFESTGRGLNYGLEVTFEKYMSDGYYFMLTGSVFSSRYKGGDGIWRNTRYNRNYLFNLLGGKEWMVGKNRRNVFGANARVTLRGGDRYSPILEYESITSQEVIFDERLAYSRQLNPVFWADISISLIIFLEDMVALKALHIYHRPNRLRRSSLSAGLSLTVPIISSRSYRSISPR